jgi:hypothetical protein
MPGKLFRMIMEPTKLHLPRPLQCLKYPALPGGVSRAAKGADCKSAGLAFVGSSPTSPTSFCPLRELRLAFLTEGCQSAKGMRPMRV